MTTVGQRANFTFAIDQQHRHSTSIDALQLARLKLRPGKHRHELFRHVLRSCVIHSDLLPENQMAAKVSRSTRHRVTKHRKAESGTSFLPSPQDE